VKVVWYDGGKLPARPQALERERTFEPKHGYMLVGDKGVIYDPSEKCANPRLLPDSRMRETAFPPKTIPRGPGGNPFLEWVNAGKGGLIPGSNFDGAAPLTARVLPGNVALRARGKKLRWDAPNGRFSNAPEFAGALRFAPHTF